MRRSAVICAAALAAVSISTMGASVKVPTAPPLPSLQHAPAHGDALSPMPVDSPVRNRNEDDVTYDMGTGEYIDKDHRWLMTGGVLFQQGDSYLQTQSALVNLDGDMKAQEAKSLAPVHLWNTQDDLTGTHGFIDFTTHVATLRDHITLIAKPDEKPQSGSSVRRQFKQPATITCDEMVYNYRKKTGHIPGPLTIRQTDRTVTADSAEYDGYRKKVVLVGHVHAMQKDGSVVDAPEVEIGIEEGKEWMYLPSHIHGVLNTKKQKDEQGGDDTATQPAPAPALPPIPETDENATTPSGATATPDAAPTAGNKQSGAASQPPASAATPSPPTH